ncbi:MAG: hypothetical protein Kow001_23060 [Acidobacteriota bacterium]
MSERKDGEKLRPVGDSPSWLTALLAAAAAINLTVLAARYADWNWPGTNRGYEPAQPIAFSHRLHGGELQIPCLYCHPAAARSARAGLPPAQLCMNCHRFIAATLGARREEERLAAQEGRPVQKVVSQEIAKIYDALGLDHDLRPAGPAQPIRWIRVHRLPAFTVFHHGVHDAARIDCAYCHGTITTMERVRQVEGFGMGWCVDCHRQYEGRDLGTGPLHPRTDCGACHY